MAEVKGGKEGASVIWGITLGLYLLIDPQIRFVLIMINNSFVNSNKWITGESQVGIELDPHVFPYKNQGRFPVFPPWSSRSQWGSLRDYWDVRLYPNRKAEHQIWKFTGILNTWSCHCIQLIDRMLIVYEN